MLLVLAALGEELDVGLSLCTDRARVRCGSSKLWKGTAPNGETVQFAKTGMGPKRAALRLERLLVDLEPSRILGIGYAGALDPHLEPGNLVIVQRASSFVPGLENSFELTGTWKLETSDLIGSANRAGIIASLGDALTSSHVIGAVNHKQMLRQRFQAAIVDMETAALAKVAASSSVPFGCIRAVSDHASDEFLAPFGYDPQQGLPDRAAKIVSAGWIGFYRTWKERSAVARKSLCHFLYVHLSEVRNRS